MNDKTGNQTPGGWPNIINIIIQRNNEFVSLHRYNDVPVIYDPAIYEQLRAADIDHLLAQHVAHLFIRDTVSLFSEKVNQDDSVDTDHFEVSL